jgi:hypothetical protein
MTDMKTSTALVRIEKTSTALVLVRRRRRRVHVDVTPEEAAEFRFRMFMALVETLDRFVEMARVKKHELN